MKKAIIIALVAFSPLLLFAQYPGAYEEYKGNIERGAAEQQRQQQQTATTNAPASTYRSPKGTWVDFPASDASPEYKAAWKRAHRARKADKADAKAAKTRRKQRKEGQEALRDLQKYNAEPPN